MIAAAGGTGSVGGPGGAGERQGRQWVMTSCRRARPPVAAAVSGRQVSMLSGRRMHLALAHLRDPRRSPGCLGTPGKPLKGPFLISH